MQDVVFETETARVVPVAEGLYAESKKADKESVSGIYTWPLLPDLQLYIRYLATMQDHIGVLNWILKQLEAHRVTPEDIDPVLGKDGTNAEIIADKLRYHMRHCPHPEIIWRFAQYDQVPEDELGPFVRDRLLPN